MNPSNKRTWAICMKHAPGENDETPSKYRVKPNQLWIEINDIFQALYDSNPILAEKYLQGFELEGIKSHSLAAMFFESIEQIKQNQEKKENGR